MADLKEYISHKEKEGHRKVKTKFKKVTSQGEDAAVFDIKKAGYGTNKFGAVNRHLINKLKG
tara:strand:- start:188 stop:373 length:186 start_codon:yes stop_codon:yes gene_type:complete